MDADQDADQTLAKVLKISLQAAESGQEALRDELQTLHLPTIADMHNIQQVCDRHISLFGTACCYLRDAHLMNQKGDAHTGKEHTRLVYKQCM